LEVARAVNAYFNANVPVEVSGQFRLGDIRHNVADISRIRALTGFEPRWTFAAGLREFLRWAQAFEAGELGFERSLSELRERGMLSGS
jgi:dTDP-L-rhamnose 4-epimerase